MIQTPKYRTRYDLKQEFLYEILIACINCYFDGEIVSKEEIFKIYSGVYFNKNKKTFRNIIGILKRYGVIANYSNQTFMITNGKKSDYKLKQDNQIKKIYSTILNQYKDIKTIAWKLKDLKGYPCIIVETDKKLLQGVFKLLKEKFKDNYMVVRDTIFNNEETVLNKKDALLVVRQLNTKAPLKKIKEGIYIPTIEKIMVDLFKDKLYEQYQNKTIEKIYLNIIKKYNVNYKRLYSYAKRRGAEEKIKQIIEKLIFQYYQFQKRKQMGFPI